MKLQQSTLPLTLVSSFVCVLSQTSSLFKFQSTCYLFKDNVYTIVSTFRVQTFKEKKCFFFFALTLFTAIFFTINGIFDTILNENRTKGELSHQEIKIFD